MALLRRGIRRRSATGSAAGISSPGPEPAASTSTVPRPHAPDVVGQAPVDPAADGPAPDSTAETGTGTSGAGDQPPETPARHGVWVMDATAWDLGRLVAAGLGTSRVGSGDGDVRVADRWPEVQDLPACQVLILPLGGGVGNDGLVRTFAGGAERLGRAPLVLVWAVPADRRLALAAPYRTVIDANGRRDEVRTAGVLYFDRYWPRAFENAEARATALRARHARFVALLGMPSVSEDPTLSLSPSLALPWVRDWPSGAHQEAGCLVLPLAERLTPETGWNGLPALADAVTMLSGGVHRS